MPFPVRGIGYDAGVRYEFDFESRPVWSPEGVRGDLRAIRHRLGCTHVLLMGTYPDRLLEAARMAGEEGLGVWIQPRLFETTQDEIADALAGVADRAEELRREFGDVALNVGCELTLSAKGFLPGASFSRRGMLLPVTSWLLPRANRRLRVFLARLADLARERFGGPISYGAGDWERPDWSIFDVAGLDAYRDDANRWRFADDIRHAVTTQHAAGRPFYIFEFGSCAYRGAAAKASLAAFVLRERHGRLSVPTSLVRDEDEQAAYLDELMDLFAEAGVDGAFVWGFSEPALLRSEEPGADLDLASYGVVAVDADGGWTPKRAFAAIAERYGGKG